MGAGFGRRKHPRFDTYTIHNGIEYADMQMIAEVYGVMRDGLGMSPAEMADVFGRWNEGRLKSYLIEITASVLEARRRLE